jgi:putative hydrolase of the HAD superfamily
MIKAIIFDLNGVFIQSPKLSDRFKKKFNVAVEDFLLALKDIMAETRKPNARDAFVYWKPYLEKWSVRLSKNEFFDFWFSEEKENLDLIELVKKLNKNKIRLFILSNNFAERSGYYKKEFDFLNIFDKIYYSWQTGFIKPNPEAFINLLLENKLKPQDCIYFDNSEENIEVAESLGIKSFIYGGVDSVKVILLDYNLI